VPIVVLHGLFGSKRNWKKLVERLSREAMADVYIVDLRHHGNSPKSGPFTMAAMAGDVCRFLDTAGVSPVFLLGHSMGGTEPFATLPFLCIRGGDPPRFSRRGMWSGCGPWSRPLKRRRFQEPATGCMSNSRTVSSP
jgi:predicted alpha/beta-fold hydrolase